VGVTPTEDKPDTDHGAHTADPLDFDAISRIAIDPSKASYSAELARAGRPARLKVSTTRSVDRLGSLSSPEAGEAIVCRYSLGACNRSLVTSA
jgi:hypothetical protein